MSCEIPVQIRRFSVRNLLPSLGKQPTFYDITTGFSAKRRLGNEHRNSFKETGNYSSRHSFFFLLQTKLGRTLTQKGSLELVVNHVPVLVSEGLTGGLIVRLVGNYAGRLHLLENAVLSSGIDFHQGMESVK